MPATTLEADYAWTKLWKAFFSIDDRDWPAQAPKLREIARQAMALAAMCEELSAKEDESG